MCLNVPYPCSVCGKSVTNNHNAIFCDTCKLWSHTKCNGVTVTEYVCLQTSADNKPWKCQKRHSDTLPPNNIFLDNNNNDVADSNIDNSSSLKQNELNSFFKTINNLGNFADITNDHDETPVGGVGCKYYDTNEFASLKLGRAIKGTSSLHTNIASLALHFVI